MIFETIWLFYFKSSLANNWQSRELFYSVRSMFPVIYRWLSLIECLLPVSSTFYSFSPSFGSSIMTLFCSSYFFLLFFPLAIFSISLMWRLNFMDVMLLIVFRRKSMLSACLVICSYFKRLISICRRVRPSKIFLGIRPRGVLCRFMKEIDSEYSFVMWESKWSILQATKG